MNTYTYKLITMTKQTKAEDNNINGSPRYNYEQKKADIRQYLLYNSIALYFKNRF